MQHNGCGSFHCVEESLNTIRQQKEKNEILAIVHKNDSCLIGYIGFGDMNRYDGYKELNYVISVDYRNQGYATEALKYMLNYAFDKLNISVIAAWVRSHNNHQTSLLGQNAKNFGCAALLSALYCGL